MLREDLDLLREASGCDAAFAITLDPTGLVFDQVAVSRSTLPVFAWASILTLGPFTGSFTRS